MTDRVNALIVTLKKDTRSDDVESLMNAIRHLRNVIDVTYNVSDPTDHIAQVRVRSELGKKLFDILYPDSHGSDQQ